jgi:hypothetical protein
VTDPAHQLFMNVAGIVPEELRRSYLAVPDPGRVSQPKSGTLASSQGSSDAPHPECQRGELRWGTIDGCGCHTGPAVWSIARSSSSGYTDAPPYGIRWSRCTQGMRRHCSGPWRFSIRGRARSNPADP